MSDSFMKLANDGGAGNDSGPQQEVVDPIDQLAMSLKWEEDYTDEYKRRVLEEAIVDVMRGR